MSQTLFKQNKIEIEETLSGYLVLTQYNDVNDKNTILIHKDYIDIFRSALNNEIPEKVLKNI